MKINYSVGNVVGSPANDELRESYRADRRKRRNRMIGNVIKYGGLAAAGLGVMYSIYRNSPEAYISGYDGEWIPVIAQYGDRIWNIASERGAGEHITPWCERIIEKNVEKNDAFDPYGIQIGDTVWVPKDFRVK